MRDVAEIGLEILLKLMQNIREHEAAAQAFYQSYYIEIMQHVFAVVTDTSHIAGLTYHSQILAHMFSLLENQNIHVPLGPQVTNPAQNVFFQSTTLKSNNISKVTELFLQLNGI